jgi:hypothetical protein
MYRTNRFVLRFRIRTNPMFKRRRGERSRVLLHVRACTGPTDVRSESRARGGSAPTIGTLHVLKGSGSFAWFTFFSVDRSRRKARTQAVRSGAASDRRCRCGGGGGGAVRWGREGGNRHDWRARRIHSPRTFAINSMDDRRRRILLSRAKRVRIAGVGARRWVL